MALHRDTAIAVSGRVHRDLSGHLTIHLQTLDAMERELGLRTVENTYFFDDLQGAIFLAKRLKAQLGQLVDSSETIAP